MKLGWMGRYRNLVGQLIRYANIYVRGYNIELGGDEGVFISAQGWQVLECIVEHEDEILKMAELSLYLGMPQSTFSKYVKRLAEQNLIERYHRSGNKKDIILRPSDFGKRFYITKSKGLFEIGYKKMFEMLDGLSEKNLEAMTAAIQSLADNLDRDTAAFSKSRLIKL